MFDNSLNRIAFWLAAHAPRILAESLNPGADATELEALQRAVGQQLPNDYRALYQRHDGLNDDDNAGNVPAFSCALCGAVRQASGKCDSARRAPKGSRK